MKSVIVHWVEMRTLEVPDECPTDKTEEFEKWLFTHADNHPFCEDPYKVDDCGSLAMRGDTRDFEIVEVTQMLEPEYNEDKSER